MHESNKEEIIYILETNMIIYLFGLNMYQFYDKNHFEYINPFPTCKMHSDAIAEEDF